MTVQFIAHAEEPRTFADKKGATKAIKRDLLKHDEAHGDVLLETGFEAKQTQDGRYGVVLFCDITPEAAKKLVGPELAGYVIQPELTEEPVNKTPTAAAPKAPAKRKPGIITVCPMDSLIQARAGSKQQAIIDLLATDNVWDTEREFFPDGEAHAAVVGITSLVGGCTMDDLRAVCVKKDGTPWDDNSIRSGLYYDVKLKGYGVTTRIEGDVAYYMLVLPKGYEQPMPARTPKT